MVYQRRSRQPKYAASFSSNFSYPSSPIFKRIPAPAVIVTSTPLHGRYEGEKSTKDHQKYRTHFLQRELE